MNKLVKLWQNQFFKNYFILIIAFTVEEIIFRLIENLSIFSYSGLRIFIGLNIISLILSFILQLLPKIVGKIFNSIIILIAAIYGIAELGFNHFLGVYASIQVNSQAGAVTDYIWDFIKSFHWTFYLLLIPFILVLTYYIFFDKYVSFDMPKKKANMLNAIIKGFYVLIIIFLILAYFGTMKLKFMQNSRQSVSSYEIFIKPTTPSLVVNEFGYIAFSMLDIKEYLFPGKELDTEINYNPDNIKEPNTGNNSNNTSYVSQTTINNITWKDIIANETDKNKNTLNKYFISNNISLTNEYTGMFEGKNLIVIMLESGSNLLYNSEFYPNLNKLYFDGWVFGNYYSPRNSCSTGNNELSGMTGLYSIYNNCTANIYSNNTYFESIFNLFKNKGYTADSYHDHSEFYYDRKTIHKNMGSDKFYNVDDMKLKYSGSEWASDAEMMEYYLKNLDKRDSNTPFMSWITTVTSHQYYRTSSKYYKEYGSLFDKSLPSDVRVYMSRLKVVDDAIGILLDGLEERGILEDTVIALFCDHYPYAINLDSLGNALGYSVSEDNLMDQVPFIIYNKGTERKIFTEYTSYVNLTPTLANLFKLDYDSRIYLGSDILSEDYNSLVLFADGSWKNEYAFFNASTNKIKYYTDKVYTDEEILAINEELSLKLKMSNLAIKTNYFSYLEKKLNSYSASTE